MPEPRLFFLSLSPRSAPSQEIPPGWRDEVLRTEAGEKHGTEIAPGVWVALTGTGDFILPPGDMVGMGAVIAVWTREKGSAC